jgi:endonuclease YncB( thermonuclease family)
MIVVLALLAAFQASTVRVVDGDTLDLNGDRVRLYGIDAPEAGQTCHRRGVTWSCGREATNALTGYLAGKATTCVEIERDRYGRAVSTCQVDGVDLGDWMVRSGWAVEFDRYSDGRYTAAEAAAVAARLGIHSGTFVVPAEWRAGGPAAEVAASYQDAGDCRIKGNINADGERIYHVPGRRSYGPTRIDTGAGERWFCSEADAVAAGWRPPRD